MGAPAIGKRKTKKVVSRMHKVCLASGSFSRPIACWAPPLSYAIFSCVQASLAGVCLTSSGTTRPPAGLGGLRYQSDGCNHLLLRAGVRISALQEVVVPPLEVPPPASVLLADLDRRELPLFAPALDRGPAHLQVVHDLDYRQELIIAKVIEIGGCHNNDSFLGCASMPTPPGGLCYREPSGSFYWSIGRPFWIHQGIFGFFWILLFGLQERVLC